MTVRISHLSRGLFDAFEVPGFAGLWTSAAAASFARIVGQLALGWTTLEATGSPFLVGVVLAARMVPLLVFGIPAGVVADRYSRRVLVAATNSATALVALIVAGAAAAGRLDLAAIVLAAFLFGAADTLRTAATQAYAYDLVREARATRGIALTNFGAQLLATIGAVAGGAALERGGPAEAFLAVAAASVVAAIGPALGARAVAPAHIPPRSRPVLWQALGLLGRHRLVATLSLAIVLVEVFGFSYLTLLPTFAHDVLGVGAAGLGALTAARSAGGVASLLLLARLGSGERGGRVFLAASAAFGLALVAYAIPPNYELALICMAVVGAAAAIDDALSQTLVQNSAPDRERGAAMGIWVFSIGFAPVGHLAIGAAADAVGAPAAQAASGALLFLVVLALALYTPLRRAK